MNSRQRYRLRKRQEARAKYEALRTAGHSCATCRCLRPPVGVGIAIESHWCEFHSDGLWTSLTSLEDLCTDWRDKNEPYPWEAKGRK